MTTVLQLTSDLNNLLNESKRRNSEIKASCDQGLKRLSKYPPGSLILTVTDDDKSKILSPLLISCNTNNARFANLSIPIIHKLVLSHSIVEADLKELLKSLLEATHLAVDIQLRILQCLPSLMANYKDFMKGDQLLQLLNICTSLTSNNKSTVVINTASATLQQLFSDVFDNVPHTTTEEIVETVTSENYQVDSISYEGFLIFQDLCKIVDGDIPTYFKQLANVRLNPILEIIEHILSTHKPLFEGHGELRYLLRIKLIPSLLRIVNNSQDFSLIIRTMRVLSTLLSSQLDHLVVEGEIILSILNHILLSGDDLHWEKVVVLEMFRNMFTDFNNTTKVFALYDFNPKKKNVMQELLSILVTFLQHNSTLFRETLQIPNPNSSNYLSKSHSSIKISVLDLLDKHEAPSTLPKTYAIYLIYNILLSYADGIAKFVNGLSTKPASELENDIDLLNSIISATYPNVSRLFQYYIHSLMDNESFHLLIRSLQKFTHTTGLLGLNDLRDSLLNLLARSIIKQETSGDLESDDESNANTSILEEQRKNLLALGESIVGSLTNSDVNLPDRKSSPVIINFNLRHVTCLRALVNLAISLGSTLDDSWRLIWVTLQWCDFYINGLDEFSGFNKNEELVTSRLSQQEMHTVTASMNKFYESIVDYPLESYKNLIKSIIGLFEEEFEVPKENNNLELADLSPCPYNKVYYINKLYDISKVNPIKYLVKNEDIFDILSEVFIKFGITSQRGVNFNLKIYIIEKFNDIIRDLANEGSNTDDNEIFNKVSSICLSGLNSLTTKLNTESSTELLVINNKIEIHLIVLNTLNELTENFNKALTSQSSWDIIFQIINNPFEHQPEVKSNTEKFNLLINSAFNSLKLILNELIVSLPVSKFKNLIDTLSNFGLQKSDLNISFSSISYFWLISDSIKSRCDPDGQSSFNLTTKDDLIDYIETSDATNKEVYFRSLDIYLLINLVTLADDHRAQVRNGSLQTFFEIMDIHGELFDKDHWKLIYNTILVKIFKINDLETKELSETVISKLDGLITLFNKFKNDFDSEFWLSMTTFLLDLIKLDQVEITVIVLDKFHDLLKIKTNSDKINLELFKFWIEFPIEYDFVTPDIYIEILIKLMDVFPTLYNKIKGKLTFEDIGKILNIFTRSIRYPIILHRTDDENPTTLQSKVLDNIEMMDWEDDLINSLFIKELSNLIVYQFKVRERIESKLNTSNLKTRFKLPTFVALSNSAFQLLITKFNKIEDINVIIKDSSVTKLLRSLLEIIENKSVGKNRELHLWTQCNEFLIQVLSKIIDKQLDSEVWKFVLRSITVCFENSNTEEENINVDQYFKVSKIILPHMKDPVIINEYLYAIYSNSYLYEFSEIEKEIIDHHQIESTISNLTQYDFEDSFGTTKPIKVYRFHKIKLVCLREVVRFVGAEDPNFDAARKYFIIRVAFTIRRLIEDERLVKAIPPSNIQQTESAILLKGLLEYMSGKTKSYKNENYNDIKRIMNLAIAFLPFSHKYDSKLLQLVLLEFNNTFHSSI